MNKHKKILFVASWLLVLPVFIMGQVSFWQSVTPSAEAETPEVVAVDPQIEINRAKEEAEQKEAKEKAQEDMTDIQKKIDNEKRALAKSQQILGQNQGAVNSTQKAINSTKFVITETVETISRKESEIKNLDSKIELQKKMLKGLLQQVYYKQGQPILNVVLMNGRFYEVFSDTEHLLTIEDRVAKLAGEISQTKSQVEQDKIELAEEKQKHEEILEVKVDQKQELVADQIDIRGEIKEKEATIAELQQQLTELKNDLNVVTGNSYNAKDIYDAIGYANGKTGVPKGILFAFLTQESGRGKNTGQCTYDDMEQKATVAYKKYGKANGWNYKPSIATLANRKGLFEDLISKLGYSTSKKVSCAIIPANFANYEPNQGGAMGVAQFMSDTWMYGGKNASSGYKSYNERVIQATGHKNPDPWSLTDGTMALAFKVRDAGGTSISSSSIKKMVTSYYGASPDRSSVARNYYDNILYYVKNYDKLANN